jgi:hypothetical protein
VFDVPQIGLMPALKVIQYEHFTKDDIAKNTLDILEQRELADKSEEGLVVVGNIKVNHDNTNMRVFPSTNNVLSNAEGVLEWESVSADSKVVTKKIMNRGSGNSYCREKV